MKLLRWSWFCICVWNAGASENESFVEEFEDDAEERRLGFAGIGGHGAPGASNPAPKSTTLAPPGHKYFTFFVEQLATDPYARQHNGAHHRNNKGNFTIRVHRRWAPKGAERFEKLVDEKFYDNVTIYLVVPGKKVQFGVHTDAEKRLRWRTADIAIDNYKKADDPIERMHNQVKYFPRQRRNKRGRVGMWFHIDHLGEVELTPRGTVVYINLAHNQDYNKYLSPFGEVIGHGMAVVDAVYHGYPEKEGPRANRMEEMGEEYLEDHFPKLTRIITVVPHYNNPETHEKIRKEHKDHEKAGHGEQWDDQDTDEDKWPGWLHFLVWVPLFTCICGLAGLGLWFKRMSDNAYADAVQARQESRKQFEMTGLVGKARDYQGPLE